MDAKFTISELMEIFRSSLIALVPIADRARIAWTGLRVYDPWENIEVALFNSLVAGVIDNIVPSAPKSLPNYGISRSEYGEVSFLTDQRRRMSGEKIAFLNLTTSKTPFDTARFLKFDDKLIASGKIIDIVLTDVIFELAAWFGSELQYLQVIEFND